MEKPKQEKTPGKKRGCLFRIARMLVVLFALLGVCFGILQSQWAKGRIVGELEVQTHALTGWTLKTGTLTGLLPWNMHLDTLELSDTEGVWLKVEEVSVRLDAKRLLRGMIFVEMARVEEITVFRLPEAGQETPVEPFKIPDLPAIPRWLAVDQLEIGEVFVSEAVLGEEAAFQVRGHFRPQGFRQDWKLHLEVAGLRETPGKALLSLGLQRGEPILSLLVEDEKLLPPMLDLAAPITLALDGNMQEGGAWRGVFSGKAGGESFVQSGVTLRLTPLPKLEATGEVQVGKLPLLAEYAPILGSRVGFGLAAALGSSNNLQVTHFKPIFHEGVLHDAGLELDTDAELVFGDAALTVTTNYRVIDAEPLGALLGQELAGGAEGRLALDNRGDALELMFRLKSDAIEHAGVAFRDPDFMLRLSSTAGLSLAPFPLEWRATGNAEAAYADLGIVRDVELRGSGTFTDFRAMEIEGLFLDDGNTRLEAQGSLDLAALDGDLDASIAIEELGVWGEALGVPIRGKAASTLTLKSPETGEGLQLEMQGDLSGISGIYDEYISFFDGFYSFEIIALIGNDGISLNHLGVKSEPLSLTGQGTYTYENNFISLNTNINSSDISPFSTLFGRDLEGNLDADLKLTGTLDALGLEAIVQLTGLDMPPITDASARAEIRLDGLPGTPQGSFEVKLIDPVYGFEGSGQVRLDDEAAHLSEVRILAGQNRIEGDFQWERVTGEVQGDISADLPELATLGGLLGLDLAGSAALSGQIALQDEALNTTGTLRAAALQTPWFGSERLDGQWDIRGTLAQPVGKAQITGANLSASGLELSSFSLNMDADAAGIVFASTGEGVAQSIYPIAYSVGGRLASTLDKATLDSLSLRLDTLDGELNAPLQATWRDNSFSVSPFSFSLAGGVLEGQARWDGASLEAAGKLTDLPLEALRVFGRPELGGYLDGEAKLSGGLANPVIFSEIHLREVESPMAAGQNMPKMALDATLQYGDGLLQVAANGDAPEFMDLKAESQLPMRLVLSPYAFDLPEAGVLSGEASGTVQLAYISNLIGSESHILAGELELGGKIGGTWAEPALDGELRVDGGRYENAATGTILEEVEILATLNREQLRLERFTAVDTRQGSLSGDGEMALDAARRFPFAFALELREAQLVYRDDYKVRVDGAASLEGNLDACLLDGDLLIGPVLATPVFAASGMQYSPVEYREISGDFTPEDDEAIPALPIQINLDLRCSMPGQIYVRTPTLDTEWRGNVRVRGTLEEPSLSGSMQAVHGQLEFLGKRFVLTDSIVNMNPSNLYAPFLNITAMTEARDVQAGLRIQGPADAFDISFVSVPALPEDEVLSYILFGRSAAEITPMQAIELTRYAALLGGQYSGMEIFNHRGRLPGLDAITIRAGEDLADTQIGFGTYLTDKLYVELLQGTVGTDASVEYRITPRIRVKGSTTSEEKSSVGLFWKWDY